MIDAVHFESIPRQFKWARRRTRIIGEAPPEKCPECGSTLKRDDWNEKCFIIFCDNDTCKLFHRPQGKVLKGKSD